MLSLGMSESKKDKIKCTQKLKKLLVKRKYENVKHWQGLN